jgi:MinD-like ATPase involved in chromosome partitioning or flagellar assembly
MEAPVRILGLSVLVKALMVLKELPWGNPNEPSLQQVWLYAKMAAVKIGLPAGDPDWIANEEKHMSKIISIHSFRGGTGKSNTSANIAAILAMQGYRVGIVDTDIQSPGIHVLFGLNEATIHHSLNDYLWKKCSIQEAAHDVSAVLGDRAKGKIHLIPASIKAGEIARVLREGYDVSLLNDGFQEVIKALSLDVLIIDTHPGLNEETLLSIAISDVLVVILRPDQQDYQGTGVTVEIARKLDVPRLLLLVNKVPRGFDEQSIKTTVEETYHAEVAAVLPHSDELMALASGGVFSVRYPNHPLTERLGKVAQQLMA